MPFGEEGVEAPDPGGAVALAVRALRAVKLAAGGVDIIEDDGRLKVLVDGRAAGRNKEL